MSSALPSSNLSSTLRYRFFMGGGVETLTFTEIHNKQKSQNAKQEERYKTRAALTKLQELKELRRKLPGD